MTVQRLPSAARPRVLSASCSLNDAKTAQRMSDTDAHARRDGQPHSCGFQFPCAVESTYRTADGAIDDVGWDVALLLMVLIIKHNPHIHEKEEQICKLTTDTAFKTSSHHQPLLSAARNQRPGPTGPFTCSSSRRTRKQRHHEHCATK